MATVWVYVDNRKIVGNADHLKVYASADRRGPGLSNMILKALRSNTK
jgi:hypothetical protein